VLVRNFNPISPRSIDTEADLEFYLDQYSSIIVMSEKNSPTPQFSPEDLKRINAELSGKSPQDILKWAIDNVQGLYQTTAFGL
jgi:hypothetical protein